MGVSKVTGAWKYTVNTSQNPWEETLLAGVIFLACQTADVKRLLQYQISSTICAITPFCFKIRKKSNLGKSQYQIKDLFLNNFSTCRVKEKFSRNTFQYKIVYYVLFSPYLEHCEIHTIREYTWHGFLQLSLLLHFSLEFQIVLYLFYVQNRPKGMRRKQNLSYKCSAGFSGHEKSKKCCIYFDYCCIAGTIFLSLKTVFM